MFGLASGHRPPECDRVNRRPSRFLTCPPRQIPEDSRSVQARKIADKSLALKILSVSQTGSRSCGRSSVFSIIYGPAGGRGYTSFARSEVCVPGKEPCAAAQGTQVSLLVYPALKRWAILFRPFGARVSPESCVQPNWADRSRRGRDAPGRWSSAPTSEKASRFGDRGEGQLYPNPNVGLTLSGGRAS